MTAGGTHITPPDPSSLLDLRATPHLSSSAVSKVHE